jgi:hypothetical protein
MQKDTFQDGKDERQSTPRRSTTPPAYRGPERRKHDRRELTPDDIAS